MGTHLLCLLPTQNKDGRERNGKKTKNQRRAYRGKKSAVSRTAETRSNHKIRQNTLSFYRQLRWEPKPAPQSFAVNSEVAY